MRLAVLALIPLPLLAAGCVATSHLGPDPASDPSTRPLPSQRRVVTAPRPADYRVKIRATSKQCYSTAGCVVSAEIRVVGDAATKGRAADLTIMVTGDLGGPVLKTIHIDANGNFSPVVAVLQTAGQKATVTGKVTKIGL